MGRGRGAAGGFPLLIKLLDAEDVLSVQVHPDASAVRRMGRGAAKTECWYILDARLGAVIYKGLRAGVTRGEFEAAIAAGTAAEMLERVEVHRGECHFLPAGTCHAIGAGLLIAEIQTPSDTTYRVFDWGRVGADGRARELHVAEALQSIRFDMPASELTVRTQGRLADSQAFMVDKCSAGGGREAALAAGEMRVLIFVKGRGRIGGGDMGPVEFAAGETVLTPAAFEGRIMAEADTEWLAVTIPTG